MTNMKRVLALMADGKPRTRAQIQDELGWSDAQSENTIRHIRAAGGLSLMAPPPVYSITPKGRETLAKPELDKATVAKLAAERRTLRRRMSAADKTSNVNSRISAKMREEREERARIREEARAEKLEEARRANEALSFIHRASTGQVPNSIFAMGGML